MVNLSDARIRPTVSGGTADEVTHTQTYGQSNLRMRSYMLQTLQAVHTIAQPCPRDLHLPQDSTSTRKLTAISSQVGKGWSACRQMIDTIRNLASSVLAWNTEFLECLTNPMVMTVSFRGSTLLASSATWLSARANTGI